MAVDPVVKRTVWRNFVFMCLSDDMEKCLKEVRKLDMFEQVHTPPGEIKVRTGKERKRELREVYMLPGYFFGRTKHWEPPTPEMKYSTKLMTTLGWGWCEDWEIERMTGVRLDAKPRRKVETKLRIGDKAFVLGPAFKNLPTGRVIAMNEGQDITMESPFFGGIPLKASVGNSLVTKTRL